MHRLLSFREYLLVAVFTGLISPALLLTRGLHQLVHHWPRYGHKEADRQEGCYERMQAGIEQEQDEVASVPPSYASSHPGAVVVVLLDAEATDAAVERPWRPQDLARVAVGKLLVVALELLSEDASILLIHRIDIVLGQKFEGIGAEERLHG